ncbi:MAG: hypothetical protein Q9M89_07750 [Persephonella sp.]|nr:hypothetical protein [Persephonella sp.]
MRKPLIFFIFLGLAGHSFSLTLEERIQQLEKRVQQLEKRIEVLEGKKQVSVPSSKITDIIVADENQKFVTYRVLSKKFKPLKLKESLWQRSDQIVLKMLFKNNTGKEINNISGKVIVYVDGKKVMEKKININKALNFFKGMTIQPGEEVKMNVEFDYDPGKSEHIKVKELPLNRLTVKFFPLKTEFADGTVKYIKYRGGE